MVDFCEAEINALNSVFTGFLHLLCRVRTVMRPTHIRANSQQHCCAVHADILTYLQPFVS